MRKIKLGDVLIKKNLRLKDVSNMNNPLVLGVTNNEGVVISKIDAGQKVEDYFVIEKGDFIYNPYRINVGSIGISDLEGITSLAYVVFNVDETRLNKYLLFKLLKSEFGIKEIIRNGRGSVRNALRFDDLAKIEFILPAIEKQNEFIKEFKKKEEKLEKLKNQYSYQLAQLENLNQAVLQEAVQGKLVAQDTDDEPASELLKRIKAEKALSGKKEKPIPLIKSEEIPFDIPKSWVWCRLGEISKFITSGSRNWNQYYSDSGDLFIRSQNIKDSKLNLSNKAYVTLSDNSEGQRTKVFLHDIIITITGAGVSNCALVNSVEWKSAYVSQHVGLIRLIKDSISKWCHQCIISEAIGKSQFKDLIYGDKPGLNLVQLNNLIIPLPPLSEQKRIIAEIENQFAKTKQLKEHVIANQQGTEQLLKALLHQAFEVKEGNTKTTQQTKGKVVELDTNTVNWDSLTAEPFEKQVAHPVNNIQDIDWEMAMMVACMKNKLGVTYGDVGLQKNVYNTNNLQPIFSKQYAFANSNFGTYCHELKEDLKRNPYLIAQKVANNKEVYAVNPKYSKQVLDKLSAPENKEFLQAINRMLSIYEHPFINKETDKIELYNTVLKVALDKNTRDIDSIYQGMKDWTINQAKYKTKAEKFGKPDAKRILKLLMEKKII